MATMSEVRERIYQTFVDGWGTTSAYTFDNEKYEPPVAAPWARLAVRHTFSSQETLGGVTLRKFDRGGTIFVQCFAPLDAGTAAAEVLAEKAIEVFEGKTLSPENVRVYDALSREIGVSDGWYQINVEIEFEYTETK